MIFAFLLFAFVMLAIMLFPLTLPRLMRLQPFLRRHRGAVNAAFLFCLSLTIALYATGCKPAPLPQGAYTAPDAQINEDLQAAHAALVQYSADVKSGAHVPTAQEKVIVNKLIDAVNIADPAYQSYHAALAANPAAAEPAALIAALANVASNLSALEALIK